MNLTVVWQDVISCHLGGISTAPRTLHKVRCFFPPITAHYGPCCAERQVLTNRNRAALMKDIGDPKPTPAPGLILESALALLLHYTQWLGSGGPARSKTVTSIVTAVHMVPHSETLIALKIFFATIGRRAKRWPYPSSTTMDENSRCATLPIRCR